MGYVAKLAERQQRNNTGANEYGGYAAKLAERQQQKAAAEAARAEARTAELERQKNVRASSLMATLNEDGHVVLPKAGSATRTPSSSYSEQNAGILRTGFTAPDPLGTVGDVLDNIGVNQKRLEALESQPAYVDAGKDVNGRNRREYVGKDYGAINDTKSRINQQKAEFTRTAAERAAAGKTVEESRTQQLIDNRLSDAPIVRYSPTKSIDAQDMTAGQRQTYDYLYQTSPKSAKAYAESIAPEVNAKTAERESAAVKEYAKDHPVTAAGLNLFTSFANGASALDAAASAVTGKEYDPNSNLNRSTRITHATQEGLTEDIENPFAKFLADTGLSTAQFLTKLPLGQTAALAVMSSGAAGQTAYDVKRSGGSTEQALLLGTIAGAAEATLEKLPLENLIGSFKGLDRTGIVAKLTSKIKQPIRDMLGSAIEEGGEEILTEYINNIADQLTRGDNSEMMQYKAQLMASGMSEAEAQKKALQQYYFLNPLLSFAGGALSGGALGGIASGSNALRTWAGDRASRMLEKAAEKAAAKATADTMDEAEINAAAGTAEATEADTGSYADVFSEVLDEEEIPQAEAWAEEDATEPEPIPETVQVRAKTVLDDGMLPSVESEKLNKKAEAAKTDTAKSGIYAGVDEDDIRAAEYLSKVYGRKILFASDNYRINGKLENGTIYINPKGQNPIGQTLAHELMHTIEQSPDAYAQLYRVLQDVTRETGVNWSQRKEELTPIYAQVYQKDGRKFTDQDATYEVAAEVLAGMISDSKQLEAMARRNRNIVTRMWSRVKAIADRITGKYRIKVDEETGEKRQKTNAELHADMYIREVENAFADALRKTKRQAKKAGAKYSMEYKKEPAGHLSSPGVAAESADYLTGSENSIAQSRTNVNPSDAYRYETLIKKPDMELVQLSETSSESRDEIVRRGLENARKVGYVNENGNAIVTLKETGAKIMVPKRSLVHGLDRRYKTQAPVIERIGEMLQNAIQINELVPRSDNISETYVLTSAARNESGGLYIAMFVVNRYNEITDIDVLYSANTKKEPAALLPKITDNSATPTGSTISIAQLLDFVNSYYPDILPMDVQNHYGRSERPAGKIGSSAKYSLSDDETENEEKHYKFRSQEEIDALNKSARRMFKKFKEADGDEEIKDTNKSNATPKHQYVPTSDIVKDFVDALTTNHHTEKFKRDLSDKLMQWYDRMSLVRDEQDYQKTNAEFIRAANEMAEEIVDSNLIKNHDNEETAENIKAILTQPMRVAEDAKRDFHGKWGKWYSSQRKWLHQSNDNGTASDVVYMELSTEYPEYFPSDIEHPGDQLRKMGEVFELISSEDFAYDSYYDFEDGENQAEIDRQNIANMIIRGWEEINKMPRTEEEILRDEVELAKRMNKEEYEARLRKKEAEYQRHVDQAVLTQNIEISRINEEAQNKVKETKEKYRQREEERKNREEQNLLKKRQERERRHRMRGGDISLDKIAKAIADNTFTQKMERLYAELKRLDAYAERYASIDIEKVEDKKLKKEILKARQDADDARMYIRNVGRVLKEAHRNEALEFLRGGDVEKWVDKKTGLQYSVNTMTRNIRDISRGDAKGKEMIKKYFDPIAQHVATATRMKNSLRQRVADLNIKTTRNTSDQLSESAFVQLLGEARDNIYMLEHHLGYTNIYNGEEYRNGKTLQEWQDVINTLMVENPGISKNEEAMQRVENAIKEFKEIYDQLIGALNHTRILNGYEPIDYRHGYFPHYSSQTAPDGLFAELFKGLGVTPDTEDLPTTINGLTRKFRPGMQYQVFAQKRGENPGESYNGFRLDGMGAVEGFDRYIETAANVIFLTEDVQRLRALSNAIRYNASKKGIKEQIDIRRNDRNLSEDEKETVIESLLANADTHLSNFVVELEEYTNLLAGKKSLRDREIEQYIGRGIYRMAKTLESRIAANMVALNPASWLTNFIPLTQAASILKTGSMLGAMGDTIKAVKEEDGFVARSNFLTNRYGSERLVRTQLQQLSDTLSKLMAKIDSFVAQTIVRARYAENLANGMTESEAMQDADKFAAGIMGDRSFGQTPTIFNQQNPVTKLVTQYQLEVANQLMWMTKDLRMYAEDKKKFAEIIVKYLLFSFFYNFFYEAAIGRKPAFDPLGILNDAVGDFTGYSLPELSEIIGNAFDDEKTLQERMLNMFKSPKTKPSEAFGNLATSVAENLPFTSVAGVLIDDFDAGRLPVASALPNIGNLGGLLDPGKSAKSKAYTAYKELSKPAAYLLPPFGGGQIKKTLEGAAAIAQGGSYVPDAQGRGQLQYPVYRTNPLDIAGALVFGKSTTQGGREWVDSGFQTLSAKKTEAFQNAMEAGATRKEAYNAVKSIKGSSVSEKRQALDGLKLDGDVKASLYYDTLASEKERGVLDAMGRTEEAYTLLRDLKGVTGNARKAEILAKTKGLTESQRETAFDNMVTDAYTDRIERVKKAGAGFNDFLQVYSTFSAAVGDEKKLKTIDAIDAMNLTDAQKDALYLCFYTESNLHNAPWNNSMPLFQIPEVSLPEIRLPQINIPKINLPY